VTVADIAAPNTTADCAKFLLVFKDHKKLKNVPKIIIGAKETLLPNRQIQIMNEVRNSWVVLISACVNKTTNNANRNMRLKLKENEYGCKTRKNGIGPAHIIATTKTAAGPLRALRKILLAIVLTRQNKTISTRTGPAIAVIANGWVSVSELRVLSHA
jgi:hypothetical protein